MRHIILHRYRNDSEREKKFTVLRQPRKLGTRYWIRFIIILIFTLLLLWYSNQTYNNPFIKRPYVKIIHNNSFFYMACYEKSNRLFNNILLFIFQFYYSGSGEKEDFKLPKTSLLYTLYKIPDLSKSFTHPPSQWIIFDSLNTNTNFNKPLSEEWPEPLYSTSFSNERTIAIQPVFPFADTTRAIQFTFNSINILILNNIPEYFSLDESSIFKERYSIIININPHRNETILQIRKLFRPLFLIIVPDNSEDILEGKNSNGILDVTEKSTFIIYKDSKGTVLVR